MALTSLQKQAKILNSSHHLMNKCITDETNKQKKQKQTKQKKKGKTNKQKKAKLYQLARIFLTMFLAELKKDSQLQSRCMTELQFS